MDFASLIALGGVLVGLGGVLVSGIAVYFTFKDRRTSHRQILYTKQIELYPDLHNAATQLMLRAMVEINQQTSAAQARDGKIHINGELFLSRIHNVYAVLLQEHHKCQLFMPHILDMECSRFEEQFQFDTKSATDVSNGIITAYNRIDEIIRQQLGIEPLSKEASRLFGKRVTPKVVQIGVEVIEK